MSALFRGRGPTIGTKICRANTRQKNVHVRATTQNPHAQIRHERPLLEAQRPTPTSLDEGLEWGLYQALKKGPPIQAARKSDGVTAPTGRRVQRFIKAVIVGAGCDDRHRYQPRSPSRFQKEKGHPKWMAKLREPRPPSSETRLATTTTQS